MQLSYPDLVEDVREHKIDRLMDALDSWYDARTQYEASNKEYSNRDDLYAAEGSLRKILKEIVS